MINELDWGTIKPPKLKKDEEEKPDWDSIRKPIYQYKSSSSEADKKALNEQFQTEQDWESLSVDPNKEPVGSEEVKFIKGQPEAIKPGGGGATGVIGEATALPIQESKLTDIFDVFKLTSIDMLHNSKQFFTSALPNLIFQDTNPKETRALEQKYGLPFGSITNEVISKLNAKNKAKRDNYEVVYKRREESYNQWIKENPELQPREEWSKGVIETIKNNPKALLDPAYWAYISAQSAAFSIAITATTLGVSAATGNPLLGMAAGVATAYPMQAQNLYTALIENGATKEQAAELSVPIGAIIASVEVAGDLPFLASVSKPFKQMLNKNITNAVATNLLAKGITTGAKIIGSETAEEVIQEAIQQGTLKTVNENIDILKNIPETVLHTAMATLPRALIGIGGDLRQNTQLQNRLDNIKKKEITEAQSEQTTQATAKPTEQKAVVEGVKEFGYPPEKYQFTGEYSDQSRTPRHIPGATKKGIKRKEIPNYAPIYKNEKGQTIVDMTQQVSIKPTEQTSAVEAVAEKATGEPLAPIEGTGETKVRGLAKSVASDIEASYGDLPEYKTLTNQEQVQKAVDIVSSDYELAKKIALGEEPAPQGLLPEFVFTAIRNKARKEGDVATQMELATNVRKTAEATVMGQKIQALGVKDPLDPVFAIQDINKKLEESVKKRYPGKVYENTKNATINKFKETVKAESTKANTKYSWEVFIKSITCT